MGVAITGNNSQQLPEVGTDVGFRMGAAMPHNTRSDLGFGMGTAITVPINTNTTAIFNTNMAVNYKTSINPNNRFGEGKTISITNQQNISINSGC